MEFSTTQASNIAALAGVIVLIAQTIFKKDVAQNDVVAVLSAIVTVVSIITNYVHRYNKGDVTVAGFKKN